MTKSAGKSAGQTLQVVRWRSAIASCLLILTLSACETSGSGDSAAGGLKIGSLMPTTGDLASLGKPLTETTSLLVEQVNACGGVNGAPVTLISEDDQSTPPTGAEAMTKLAEVDQVAGVVGAFGSSISNAALDIAVRSNIVLISPGSTSTLFTERAKQGDLNGFWARTAPPDNLQAAALANLAHERGFKRVSTVVINNDYGRSFEKEFIADFKKLGGTIVNEANPTRYDERATTFNSEAAAAFAKKPDAVAAILYPETGSLLIKSAFEQGLTSGVQIMLTDGMKTGDIAQQVGKTADGKFILAGAIGTVPGADGKGLATLEKLWQEKKQQPLVAYVPQTWDAGALLVLAAQAAKANTGEAIKSKLREVANGPGEQVDDVCKGLALLREGKPINYQGASGNVNIDENGDVVGVYDIWQVKPDGAITTIGKVQPK